MGVLGIVDTTAKEANTVGGEIGRYEVKRSYGWKMEFSFPSSKLLHSAMTTAAAAVDSFMIQIQKAARPSMNVSEITLHHGNERYYLAGKPTFDTLSVDFYDALPKTAGSNSGSEGGGSETMESAASLMWRWYTTIYDPVTGALNLASDYKANAFVTLYAPNGAAVEKWMYLGIWPTKVDMGTLDYSTEAELHVTATMRYDKVYRIATEAEGSPDDLPSTYVDVSTLPE